jgi:hypothetical protein
MSAKAGDPDPNSNPEDCVDGDPGVGGLIADPLASPAPHGNPGPKEGPPSPDPAPPDHHGDWMPTRRNAG